MSQATATATKAPETKPEDRIPPRPLDRERVKGLAESFGEMLSVVLPDDSTIEEGPQNPLFWSNAAARMAVGQWLQVTNDAGSFFAVMRVERIHGGGGYGSALRALALRHIVPARTFDQAVEPIVPTGEWYYRHGGGYRKWMVISTERDRGARGYRDGMGGEEARPPRVRGIPRGEH